MSAASLKNKTLQLAELIISNEKYSDSTGYVASTASIDSALTTISFNIPSITVDTISTVNIQSDTSLTLTASSGVVNIATESIGLFNADTTSAVSLACVDSVFTVSEAISAPSITSLGSITIGTAPASVELTAVSNTLLLGDGNSILECGNITSVGSIILGATGDSVVLSGTANKLLLGGGNSLLECGNITSFGTITAAGSLIIENGANTCTLSSIATDALSINSSQGALFCGEITALANISTPGNVSADNITIGNTNGSGTLTVNASNQLLWNGVVIS